MITIRRFYHVTHVVCTLKKQGIKLTKMLNPKMKKRWYPSDLLEVNPLPSVKNLARTKHEPGKRANRRVAMLNKIFMKQITDLMSTGTVAMDIVGRGIEISKVQMASDYQTINVFWVCKGTDMDEEIEAILRRTAGTLRHELSTLRLMGEVPRIAFVKDIQEAKVIELDRLLAIADFGEDYQTTEAGHILKSEFTLNTKLSPEIKAKIKQLEDELPLLEEPIPEMTNTVYGLDHTKIMSRLLAAKRKIKMAWDNVDSDTPVLSYRNEGNSKIDVDYADQKKELADFLLKRKIQQNKLRKELNDQRQDWQRQYKMDSPYEPDDENEDYVEEEEEEDDYYYYEDAKSNESLNNSHQS